MDTVIQNSMDDNETNILDTLTVKTMLTFLTEEERVLLELWMSGSFTLDEIGRIYGQKFYGEDLSPSIVSYRRDKILDRLRRRFFRKDRR